MDDGHGKYPFTIGGAEQHYHGFQAASISQKKRLENNTERSMSVANTSEGISCP